MATLFQLAQVSASTDFQHRVSIAMATAAAQVYAEINTTTGHTARAAFANKVATGQYSLPAAAQTVLSNSTVAGEASTTPGGAFDNAIPDADIQFAVSSLWNLFSGA
jgi:hypothetical protein